MKQLWDHLVGFLLTAVVTVVVLIFLSNIVSKIPLGAQLVKKAGLTPQA